MTEEKYTCSQTAVFGSTGAELAPRLGAVALKDGRLSSFPQSPAADLQMRTTRQAPAEPGLRLLRTNGRDYRRDESGASRSLPRTANVGPSGSLAGEVLRSPKWLLGARTTVFLQSAGASELDHGGKRTL
jgi:hypothetical protein